MFSRAIVWLLDECWLWCFVVCAGLLAFVSWWVYDIVVWCFLAVLMFCGFSCGFYCVCCFAVCGFVLWIGGCGRSLFVVDFWFLGDLLLWWL